MFSTRDMDWMQRAIQLARQAEKNGEVPIGAILVCNDQIIGEGYNQSIGAHDTTAHAEMIALRQGAQAINNYRLINTTLYVTLEPCLMCLGAITHARVQHLIFGAHDPKAGALESQLKVKDLVFLNHQIHYKSGLLQAECS